MTGIHIRLTITPFFIRCYHATILHPISHFNLKRLIIIIIIGSKFCLRLFVKFKMNLG